MAAVCLAAGHAYAQGAGGDVAKVVHDMGIDLGLVRGLEQKNDWILASQLEGAGTAIVDGKKADVARYQSQIRWDIPGIRVDYQLAGQAEHRISVLSGQYAWSEDKPGAGLLPGYGKATPAPKTHERLLIEMWAHPHGVYKAARLAGDQTKLSVLPDGRRVLTFPAPPPLKGLTFVATLPVKKTTKNKDCQGGQSFCDSWAERIEVKRGGTTVLEGLYTDYKDLDLSGVYYPTHIVQRRDGQTVLDIKLSKAHGYNPYVVMPTPANIKAGPVGSPVAPKGVWAGL
jgi:hypothetical protein